MLVITTQVFENYGAHCWDGKGDCPQYWKAKGGNEYKVPDVDVSRMDLIRAKVAETTSKVTEFSDYYREYVIDWFVADDNYLTESEEIQQLERDWL